MNANSNNSANTNNSNINAMNANNIEFVCSDCGSKHIIARPKTAPSDEDDTPIIHSVLRDNAIMAVIVRHLNELPVEVAERLKGFQTCDSLVDLIVEIEEGGYIKQPKVVKRFLIGQALKLVEIDGAMKNFLKRGGYRYALRVMENELNLMAHMEANGDTEALEECSMIWTDRVFYEAMDHWCSELEKAATKTYRIHSCKGRKYVKIRHYGLNNGKGIFLDEWNQFMDRFYNLRTAFLTVDTYQMKLKVFRKFVQECKKAPSWTPSQSKAFENAFRAAGGYYTLKDLILFEGVKLEEGSQADQLELLKTKYVQRCGENGALVAENGYKMFGYLKKVLEDNHFDFQATKQKWYEASQARKAARQNHERRSRN